MRKFVFFLLFFFICVASLDANYQLMTNDTFQEKIVGNTIVGVTRQSKSLYMLYFQKGGFCELWKQNHIYLGKWWIDEENVVHAFWPDYTSEEPKSLFSPQNPSFGKSTSLRYYFDPQNDEVLIAGKTFQARVLLVPGSCFPN